VVKPQKKRWYLVAVIIALLYGVLTGPLSRVAFPELERVMWLIGLAAVYFVVRKVVHTKVKY